ncbi:MULTISPECIES: hypothetical protein [unclassified Nostoc]|uniref:hypothetical protein n=1 Tax=unclassified Nostoc TaxID=2593658 RepID=UPI0026155FDD|nr:hypothetical protein [Nostoc sp. S13]MDF5739564.1 hypothetical protein [Nostoc sp. S13]
MPNKNEALHNLCKQSLTYPWPPITAIALHTVTAIALTKATSPRYQTSLIYELATTPNSPTELIILNVLNNV